MDSTFDLLTVPGAVAAAILVVKFLTLTVMPSRWARKAAIIVAALVFIVATVSNGGDFTLIEYMAMVLTGLSAGLAANAAYDSADSGMDYMTIPREDVDLGPR